MHLLSKIEKFRRETNMSHTRFGRLSVHDPRFVQDLRNGREPGLKVHKKVEHFMNIWRRDHG